MSQKRIYIKRLKDPGRFINYFEKITDPITKEEIEGIISELTDAQIINIIKQVAEKTRAVGQELTTEILPMVDTYCIFLLQSNGSSSLEIGI